MPLLLGSTIPNIEVNTTEGKMKLNDYQNKSWLLFMSHPADYTPVCTTELGRAAFLNGEFEKRNVKLIGLSCDTVESHMGWVGDVMDYGGYKGQKLPYPIIADPKRELANRFGMIDPDEKDEKGAPLTCRACMVIDPLYKLRLSILYPASTGRNFDEILRIVDSLQLNTATKVVTPCEWKPGEKVLIPPTSNVKDFESQGFKVESTPTRSGKDYMRWMAAPK